MSDLDCATRDAGTQFLHLETTSRGKVEAWPIPEWEYYNAARALDHR